MKKHILQAHRILTRIDSDGAYSNMAFFGEGASDMATLLVYGVLEKDIRLEYIINSLVDKRPQRAIYTLLKIGAYALENLSDVPKFAIVSECVESAKSLGKGGASGFVNAVLKNVADGKYKLPCEADKNYLSVKFSKPEWFIQKLERQFGRDVMLSIISAKSDRTEHLRVNSRLSDTREVLGKLEKEGAPCRLSEVGGIVARVTSSVKEMFSKGLVTYQSPSSMLAVQALGLKPDDVLLDICSAPGGKAVYASELCDSVLACELHPHRIDLIEKYKKRMRADNVRAVQWDATKFQAEWEGKFDCVLADVPCSCFGTFLKHPDVFRSRGESEIKTLADTQARILENASKYVKQGGTLVYSTCTLFDEENGDVVRGLLDKGGFSLQSLSLPSVDGAIFYEDGAQLQILPHGVYDGFYVAKLLKL